MEKAKEEIHIVRTEYGKYMCTAIIRGQKFTKIADDILMATAWAETVADYSIGDLKGAEYGKRKM